MSKDRVTRGRLRPAVIEQGKTERSPHRRSEMHLAEIPTELNSCSGQAMMPLRRTPLLPPGRGLRRPGCFRLGASSVAGAAGGGAGLLRGEGRGSGVVQIAFCPLRLFLTLRTGVQEPRRRSPRLTGGSRRTRSPAIFFMPPLMCAGWPGVWFVHVFVRPIWLLVALLVRSETTTRLEGRGGLRARLVGT